MRWFTAALFFCVVVSVGQAADHFGVLCNRTRMCVCVCVCVGERESEPKGNKRHTLHLSFISSLFFLDRIFCVPEKPCFTRARTHTHIH